MSETTSTPAEGTPTGQPVESATQTESVKTAEWYEAELSKVRQEAASNRVKGKEKADAVRAEVAQEYSAKLAESASAIEAVKTQLDAANTSLARLNAAIDAGVPVDKLRTIAARLNGSTPEELKADAEEVKNIFGISARTPAVDPSQGLGGDGIGTDAADIFSSFFDSKLGK